MELGSKVIVRTYSAGCFFGILKSREGKEVLLLDCRRLWYWAGGASLSELATRGTSQPGKCKFPAATAESLLLEAIEIIAVSDQAYKNLSEVPVWSE
jgi:hypothetical protein